MCFFIKYTPAYVPDKFEHMVLFRENQYRKYGHTSGGIDE